jgi:UDP-glucose 4-epimerase
MKLSKPSEATGAQIETRYKLGRAADVPRSVLDCTRARTDFGWIARRPLRKVSLGAWEWLLDLVGKAP